MRITRLFPGGTVQVPTLRAGEAAPPGGAPAPTPTPGAGGDPAPAPGTNPAQEKRLSDENARYRVRLKTLSEALGTSDPDEMVAKVNALKAPAPHPAPDGDDDKPTLVKLQRKVSDLEAKLSTSEKTRQDEQTRGRAKILTAGLTKIAAEAGLTEPEAAVDLLTGKAKVADDGELVFVVPDGTGGTREVVASVDTLREHTKALRFPVSFFPAGGHGGSGSGAPGRGAGGGSAVDAVVANPSTQDDKLRERARAEWFGQAK